MSSFLAADWLTILAEEMHANSADVGGNNTPVTGGTYNPDGLTVADVLSTAVAAPAIATAATLPATAAVATTTVAAPAATPTVAGAQATQTAASATASHTPAVTAADAGDHSTTVSNAIDAQHAPLHELAHHFAHMWG